MFEAENLDDALELARGIPAARYGAIEVRPIYHTVDLNGRARTPGGWRCCWSHPQVSIPLAHWSGRPNRDGTANSLLRQAITSSQARLCTSRRRRPRYASATARRCSPTVRSRKAPRSPRAFYLLTAADRDEAVKLASMIPASAVEVRQLAKVSAV